MMEMMGKDQGEIRSYLGEVTKRRSRRSKFSSKARKMTPGRRWTNSWGHWLQGQMTLR